MTAICEQCEQGVGIPWWDQRSGGNAVKMEYCGEELNRERMHLQNVVWMGTCCWVVFFSRPWWTTEKRENSGAAAEHGALGTHLERTMKSGNQKLGGERVAQRTTDERLDFILKKTVGALRFFSAVRWSSSTFHSEPYDPYPFLHSAELPTKIHQAGYLSSFLPMRIVVPFNAFGKECKLFCGATFRWRGGSTEVPLSVSIQVPSISQTSQLCKMGL